jgi:cardiolipin synthase
VTLPIKFLVGGLVIAGALLAAGHAIIYKRDSRSAALWIVVIWLMPAIGPILYLLLGINQVRRRAVALREAMVRHRTTADFTESDLGMREAEHLEPLARLVGEVAARPLLPGNAVAVLVDGKEAYPAMLEAIESATKSVGLASYIFDATGIGERFIEALASAQNRGVEVRVLVDAVGAKYSWPSAARALRHRGIQAALFNPRLTPRWLPDINLRNHRKILVVDGTVGFTGGFNIKHEFWQPETPAKLFRDLHFSINGPVVAHLSEVFVNDWQFATGEALRGDKWFPPLPRCGDVLARGIEAGPDESHDRLRWVIIGALNSARRSVEILTPYFLPDAGIISALTAAALRGVEVNIVLPEHSNLTYVNWATFAQLWQVLQHGCRVWLTRGPFDHSKLMVVDGVWAFLGSANWDTRSLRLNFEFNVEAYNAELGKGLEELVRGRRAEARELSLGEVDARSLPIRLRDGIARLFAPYL